MIALIQLGDVAIGAAFRAGEKSADKLSDLRSRWDRESLRTAAEAWARWTVLAERGAAERERGRRGAQRAVDAAVERLAHSELVGRVVDAQLERVLSLLENEPDRIRALVRGQRETIVGEAVGRVRAGAAAGDTAVDRLTLRMTRRGDAP
ncbi:hypothetical protein [Actinoplanes regularis]|uniref:Uncharacterized protein n=1 Tax=Actinoplanes regularis TaxID=52697 RepID=A0A239HU37_9ACTN|nr:hypothetical protein [Actinoplanes regularis]GIE91220.1 hypothetical protein Are01nite_77000 [Actinoplanes regularis]GLW34874.1 hypothetical protein Areg01_78100 [Actinoplanes regularis]SNS84900.1 hypothetical protein SAMN06264365_12631 [Actinoplanes regularis]